MKTKLFVFSIFFALFEQPIFAQSGKDSSNLPEIRNFLKLKIGADNGLEWEQKIAKYSVITLFGGIGIGFQSDDYKDFSSALILVPVIYADYRNYYNYKARIARQKNVVNNSANFLFGEARTSLAVTNQNYFGLFFIEGWGMQRSLANQINFDFHIGIAEHFYYDRPPVGGFNYLKIEPDAQVTFSYIF